LEELFCLNKNPNILGRGEVYTGSWWGNLNERHHLEDPGVDERIKDVPKLVIQNRIVITQKVEKLQYYDIYVYHEMQ